MKIKHIKHNACRLLSLLLVVAALSGLLTVGAWADGETAPKVTLKVVNTTVNPIAGQPVNVSVYLSGLQEGVVVQAVTFSLSCPDGFYLDNIDEEDGKSDDMTSELQSSKGTNAIGNNGKTMTYFYTTTSSKNVVGTGEDILVSNVTIQTPATVYGSASIGISATGLNVANDSDGEFVVATQSASVTFPSATLTFDMNGHGTQIDPMTVAPGSTVTAPEAPAGVTGYTFGDWYTDAACTTEYTFGVLNEDTTVYAKWKPDTVFVQLDADGGTCENEGVTVIYDSAYGTLPEPVKTGHKFLGWYDGETEIKADTKVEKTETHTLKAKWQINTYTVTLEPQGGTLETKTVTRDYNEPYGTLPTPTRDDFKFTGWFTSGEKVEASDMVVMDVTLYAQWVLKGQIDLKKEPQTFTYGDTGIQFEVKVGEDDPKDGYTVSYQVGGEWTETAPTNAGTYHVWVCHAAEGDLKELDMVIMDGLVIKQATVKEPAADENKFEYDGNPKTYNIAENTLYAVSGDTQTNAGEYKVTVSLKDPANYKWETADNSENLEYNFVIAKAKVAKPTADTTKFTYDGSDKTYTLAESDKYTVSTNTTQKDAGTYDITVSLNDTNNYQWADGTTDALTFPFTIAKKELDKPTAKSTTFTYNGGKQKLELNDTAYKDLYTLTNNERTHAGTYTAIVTLTDPDNYCWKGETGDSFYIPFSINPKPVTAPTAGTSPITYDDKDHTFITLTDEMVLAEGSDAVTQKNAGTYTIKVALKDKGDLVWADTENTDDKTYTVVINKAEQTAPAGVTTEAESIFKKNDGKINGVNKDMEYSADDGKTWTPVSGNKLENLKPGEYKVRYAETENHNASPDTEVTIAAGEKLKASFITGAGGDVPEQTGLGYGDALNKPEASYDGFTLVGWYKEDSYKHEWNFATDRMGDENITLHAKWELSIGIEGDARFTEGKAPAEGVKIVVGKGRALEEATAELKKVTVDGKKLDAENYAVAYGEDGLTITLKQEYLNTLGDDEYEIGVVVNSEHLGSTDRELSVTLTVDPVQGAAGKPAGKPGKAVKTGDSSDLLLWSVLTLGAGAGLVCIGKKRREN